MGAMQGAKIERGPVQKDALGWRSTGAPLVPGAMDQKLIPKSARRHRVGV